MDWLGDLTSLTTLDLSSTSVFELPDWLRNLTSLTTLNLGHNGLDVLPDSLESLTSLTTLDIRGNYLGRERSLPYWLGSLTSLTKLDLDENRLTSPPPEVVEAGTEAVLAYLRANWAGSGRQWASKMLIVATARSPKTPAVSFPLAGVSRPAVTAGEGGKTRLAQVSA
jgi:internalin A